MDEQIGMSFSSVSGSFSDLNPSIVRKFWKYHSANPAVFELFRKFSNELKRSGRKHYGAKAVMERIRWHFAVETVGDDFKLNNNYTSCYARLMVLQDDSFDGFFAMRTSAS